VIVISASEDPVTVSRALDFAASGFIPKSAPSEHLAEAMRAVLDGDLAAADNWPGYLPGEEMAERRRIVVADDLWFPEHAQPPDRAEDIALGARLSALTPQQLKVFTMLAEGRPQRSATPQQVRRGQLRALITTPPQPRDTACRTSGHRGRLWRGDEDHRS
jgi:DNA-binding NarL/FixJ family response regulator